MKHSCLQVGTKGHENVIARSVSDEAISKDKIAAPSARNDRIEVFPVVLLQGLFISVIPHLMRNPVLFLDSCFRRNDDRRTR